VDVEKPRAGLACASAFLENDCEAIGGLDGSKTRAERSGWKNVGFVNIRSGRMDVAKYRAYLLLAFILAIGLWFPALPTVAQERIASPHEFSGSIIKQVHGKKYQAQVFAKGDRLRLEYKYAIRTDYGYAAIEIIRLDREEAWYLLAQQKELLITPLDPDDVLPMQPTLPGERGRTLVGEATAVGRAAQLYEVQTDRRGRTEQWYEWVDVETGTVLKLVSRDRDWSFAYERIRWSPQPTEYFNEPPGYRKRAATVRGEQG
jgi:hypothetical protein